MPGPMSSPLAMNGLGESDQQTVSMGLQNLLSGKVSPDEVQEAAGKLSSNTSWLSDHLARTGGKATNPYVFGSPGGPPQVSKPQMKNQTTKSDKTTTNTNYSPEEWQSLLGMVGKTPEIEDQRQGIKDQEDMLKIGMANQGHSDDYWVRPLSALADATTGSNLSQNYKGQQTQGQRNEKYMSAMDELSKRKGDLSKTILEGVGKLKSGSTQDQSQLLNMIGQGMGGMGGLQEIRREKMRIDAGNIFNNPNDPIAKMEAAYNSADRAQGMISGKVPVTSANYNTLQEDVTKMLNMGGTQVADAKLQREATSLFAEIPNKLQTYFDATGKDADLRTAAPETFKRLQEFIAQIRQDYDAAYEQRLKEKTQPYMNSIYPEVAQTAMQQADMKRQARIGGQTLQEKAAGAAPPVAKGRTKELKDMTQAELDAYEKSLHGG